jgi:hypothetical protein
LPQRVSVWFESQPSPSPRFVALLVDVDDSVAAALDPAVRPAAVTRETIPIVSRLVGSWLTAAVEGVAALERYRVPAVSV